MDLTFVCKYRELYTGKGKGAQEKRYCSFYSFMSAAAASSLHTGRNKTKAKVCCWFSQDIKWKKLTTSPKKRTGPRFLKSMLKQIKS